MIISAKYHVSKIAEMALKGDLLGAKEEIQSRCKSKPEKQARRLAQTVGHLIDHHKNLDVACKLINMFDN